VTLTSKVIAAGAAKNEICARRKTAAKLFHAVGNQRARRTQMSAKEDVQQINEQVLSAAAKGDFSLFANILDDEVEVFDHAPYLFEGKNNFLAYLQSAVAGNESTTYTFHQSTCKAVTDTTVVVNAYDRLTAMPKGGGAPKIQSGRATWVYAKRGRDWKIVSAHFSPLPHE
jgi:uncharacterized protein (TIGR02246 family)